MHTHADVVRRRAHAPTPSARRLCCVRSPRRHPLHFGREAIARLLGNPRLADWKTCLPCPAPGERASTEELEKRMADDFREAFAAYDPAAEE
jgi:hypothetical protein